jgi:hypothetical protein
MGRKMEPKLRTFATIVVRGKEQEGVKFWGFGKTIYEKLLATISEPEWGDITDPINGHDINVEFKTKEEVGKDFPETDITLLPSQTPLTKDDALMTRLLDEQKEIFDVYPKPTFEELHDALGKFLNPDESEETTTPAEPDEVPQKTKPAVKSNKHDVSKEFEAMFNEADKAK